MKTTVIVRNSLAAGLVLLAMLFGCAATTQSKTGQPAPPAKNAEAERMLQEALAKARASDNKEVNVFLNEEKGKVQEGDYVRIKYTATLKNGDPVRLLPPLSSLDLADYKVAKAEAGGAEKKFDRLLLAGNAKDPLDLGAAIVGMAPGQSTRVTVAPEKAYGVRSSDKVRTIPRVRRLPSSFTLLPDEFYKRFKAFPMKGAKVDFNPYVQAEVVDILAKEVALRLLPEHGRRFEEPYGYTEVTVDPATNEVVLTLNPELGAYIMNGRIVAVDDDFFVLDLNHPLSGEAIDVNITIEEIVKPSQFGNERIQWLEDMETARNSAQKDGKPIVLMLYADWCKWCKQMFGTTYQDPWVRYFKDAYVWVKINSDKEKQYMQDYGQKGFPMTVLLDSNGEVIRRLSGFKDALALRTELLEGLNFVHQDTGANQQARVSGTERSAAAR